MYKVRQLGGCYRLVRRASAGLLKEAVWRGKAFERETAKGNNHARSIGKSDNCKVPIFSFVTHKLSSCPSLLALENHGLTTKVHEGAGSKSLHVMT